MTKPCEHFEALISHAADAALSAEETIELQNHLSLCQGCREFERSVHKTSELFRRLPLEELRTPLRMDSEKKQTRGPLGRLWHSRVTLPAPLAAAAMLMLACGVAWLALHRAPAPGVPTHSATATINYVQIEKIPPGSGTPIVAPQKP